MVRRLGWYSAVGIVGILAWIMLVVMQWPLQVRMVLATTAAASVWVIWKIMFKQRETQSRDRTIRLLNHYRHDWMNELQVLFGYLRLGKYDVLSEYMNKIKASAIQDSLLSKLGNTSLIMYLLEHRISASGCLVELELETEIDLSRLDLDGDKVYRIVRGVIERMVRYGSCYDEPGVVSLGFDIDNKELLVDFVYQGQADWISLQEEITVFLNNNKDNIMIREEEYEGGRAVVALALPFEYK